MTQPFEHLCKNCRYARPYRDGGVLEAMNSQCAHPSSTVEEFEPVMGQRKIVTLTCRSARFSSGDEYCGPDARFWKPLGFT